MPGNPKGSPWHSTPAAKRKRKPLTLTISDTSRLRLERLAAKHKCSISQVVEALADAAEDSP